MRQIASEADVDVSLLSHSFGSKLGLWQAVIDHVAERVVAVILVMEQEKNGDLSEGEYFRHVMEQLIDLICDTPLMAKFVVKEVAQHDARSDYVYERLIKPPYDLLLPLLKKAREAGDIGDIDPELFFFVFTGSIAMTVATRSFIIRFSPTAAKDETFRRELKRTLFGQLTMIR
ncbi:TetR/AcrR family transcriptional regulator [Sodalis sp. RH22]|uniref:TetR/AcrR family transcriptional regulator n=1 Tax=unclassified Sodalis (in: enterobacteria) TaxID=2636512 RepID=UPI0039B3D0B1